MMILVSSLISLIGLKIIFDWYYNYAHEKAHSRIYENNKIKYKMKITPFDAWCDGEQETKETIRDHNLTDAIGYHLKVIFDFAYFVFGLIVLVGVLI